MSKNLRSSKIQFFLAKQQLKQLKEKKPDGRICEVDQKYKNYVTNSFYKNKRRLMQRMQNSQSVDEAAIEMLPSELEEGSIH